MTVQELSQLYYLNREIEADQRRLDTLEAKIGLAAPRLTGMPHGGGENRGQTEALAAEIVDLQAIIAAKQIQCIHERARLERYIMEIPDSMTRSIFEYRFVSCMPWNQVAMRVGGPNTADGVKKRCYRYLKTTEEAAEGEAVAVG